MEADARRVDPLVAREFECVTRRDGDRTVITIVGDIDLATGPVVREVVSNAFAVFGRPVVVDLRQVEFIDSAGVHAILKWHADADREDLALEVSAPRPNVMRVFEMLGVVDQLRIRAGAEGAFNQ